MRFDFLYYICPKYFLFEEDLRETWKKMYIGVHVKYLWLFSDFHETWLFWTDFRKILKYQIVCISVQWEPSYAKGRTERLTDTTKLLVAFCNFANALKKALLKFEVIRHSLSCVVTFFTAFRQITASFHFAFNSFIHRPPIWGHYAELRMSSN